MFGGGEEYFQEPPEIDCDTLRRYASFCACLRSIDKPSKKIIFETTALARDVGDNLQSYELVVGALFRHIKSWTGTHQLACWYVLDKLSKEDRDKYGYIASKYILDIGRDYIPYEDPVLAPKYEKLVQHWEKVFPRHVVDAIWVAKKERLWAVNNPSQVLQQQQEEMERWQREEQEMQDEDGLNLFGQPCMDYLQGNCMWGSQCRFFHPQGQEGSLPPECRMGDWKCPSCGVINRHFRRRCGNCVHEKPQYKKMRTQTAEDDLLTSPDVSALSSLRQQFGYNPYILKEVIKHWKIRFEHTNLKEYLDERRAAYKVRILSRKPNNPLEEYCKTQKHFPDIVIEPDEEYQGLLTSGGVLSDGSPEKRARYDNPIPSGTTVASGVGILSQLILERGVRDTTTPTLFTELGRHLHTLSKEKNPRLSASQAQVFLSVVKLGITAWNASKDSVPFVASFLKIIRDVEGAIGLSSTDFATLVTMTRNISN